MKSFRFSSILLLIASTLTAQTVTTPPREPSVLDVVSVTGTGKVRLQPDRFSFTVGVQTQAPTVEEAVNENNARVAAVTAALKKAGAAADEIQTSGFSIYPQQDYSQQSRLPRLIGYQVSNNITVTRKQMGDAGKLLQAAIGAGVNTSSGLSFSVSDPAAGRNEGLRAAFADARAKAGVLASAAGRALGAALAISEGTQPVMIPRGVEGRVMSMSKAADVSQVPVESGTEELTFQISVVFALR